MACLTLDGGMFTFERVARLVVIKFLLGGLPVNELKVRTVVLGTATGAVFVGVIPFYDNGMKPLVGLESLIDFGVALQTLETPSDDREPVTARTLRRPG